MNFSLSHLTLSSLSRSPYLSQKSFLRANFLKTTRCFSPFFYSKNLKKLSIKNSAFSKYLSPAIITEKDAFLIGKQYEYAKQDFTQHTSTNVPIKIINCVFKGFDKTDEDGGAFRLTYRVRMYNVIFSDLKSKNGGCFFINDELQACFVTFDKCEAIEKGGMFVIEDKNEERTCEIEFCSFSNGRSNKFGAFLRTSDGKFSIKNTNFTRCASTNVGVMETKCEQCTISFNNFVRCSASGPNGGLVFKQPTGDFLASHCNFNLLSQTNKKGLSATAILIEDPQTTDIEKCNFLRNAGAKTIAFNSGGPVTLKSCTFSGKESHELFSESDEFIKSGCSFGSSSLEIIQANFDLGYTPDRPFTPEGGIRKVFGKNVTQDTITFERTIAKLLFYSTILGFILYHASQFVMLHINPKKPRALE